MKTIHQASSRSLFATVALMLALTCALVMTPAQARRELSPYCMGTAPLRRVELVAGQDAFRPREVSVKQGECVELTILAEEGPAHNAVIENTRISSAAAPIVSADGRVIGHAVRRPSPDRDAPIGELSEGWFATHERVEIRFQANEPGQYKLRCTVGQMLETASDAGKPSSEPPDQDGMIATIVVRPSD